MPQANKITTDYGREVMARVFIGDAAPAINSFTLRLGQSAAIGGTDVTETTTTTYTEISGTGGYAPVTLTPGTDFNVTNSGGVVSFTADGLSGTPSGGNWDDFDQVLITMDVGGTEYVLLQVPTAETRTIVEGQPYDTGPVETEAA